MTVDSKGRELFIVDNSVSGWTGLRYLEEWSSIAKAFDIATGYFEIGALLTLDGKWQGLDKIRILMGAEITYRTRKAILEAVRAQALDRLDESIEEDKEPNPFLHGVPAILDALRSGQIECRVYDKDKFHAKAYITHARLEVVGAQALVGSSNFTRPGLTKNIELNVQVQERARGRAAPGVVRDALGRGKRGHRGRHRDDLAPYAPVFAIRRLREGPAAVLPGARADRDRVGRETVANVPAPRSLSEGGVLGAHEDRPAARRCVPL